MARRGRNETGTGGWFTTAYFHHPAEIAEVACAGLLLARIVMVESAVWMLGPERLDEILDDPERRAEMLGTLRSVEAEPSLFGSSSHLLVQAHRA